ncbi:hypothetical protein HYZ41_04180 [archaeon]|nr:hypothetical protein [archaeon]
MNEAKYVMVFAVFILFASAAFATPALPNVIVSDIDPQPVEPGRDVVIDIVLYNRLTTSIDSFSVRLDYQFPFIFKSSSENLMNQNLCIDCSKKNTYFFSIDPTAVSGIYPVYIKTYSNSSEVSKQIDVRVRGTPSLVLAAPTNGLNNVTPDSQFSVVLDVKNIGSGQARQIRIQPESTNFIVLGGGTKTIDAINASQSSFIQFDFITASEIDANSYSLPFRLYYLDEEGNSLNTTQSLGLKVVNKGDINIQSIKTVSALGSSTIIANQPFTVVARLENVGHGNADFVTAEITCPFNGAKKAFIGQLKKDENGPAVFDFISTATGQFKCNINTFYTDDIDSHTFSDSFDVTVIGQDYSGSIVTVIIIIIILLYLLRKKIFRKKK